MCENWHDQSLYAPGLVKQEDKPYIHGSADTVLLVKDSGTKLTIPVEGKGRVPANTFHKTIRCFIEKHSLSNMSGLGSDTSTVKSFDIDDDDEDLLGLVSEYHDLFQLVHHSYLHVCRQTVLLFDL